MAADQLRTSHFAFLRAAVQGLGLRDAWERYLIYEGGPDDQRHFRARERELVQLVRFAAERRGLREAADLAFGPKGAMPSETATSPPPESAPEPAAAPQGADPQPRVDATPTLDEWITQRCDALGVDPDFHNQAEWLEQYQEEFGLDQVASNPAPRPATAEPAPSPAPPSSAPGSASTASAATTASAASRVAALNELAAELSKPATLGDPLASWLAPTVAKHLTRIVVDGRPMALQTLNDLIAFINLQGHRWWASVPLLGETRAKRIVTWLTPLAESLGRPLLSRALVPLAARVASERSLAEDHAQTQVFAMVPLARLAVPPQLDGRHGEHRQQGPNAWGAQTDLQAIQAWLRRHIMRPRTFSHYGRMVERFYLWCVLVRRLPLSSLVEADFFAYNDFLADPPADWVQRRAMRRDTRDWRPLRGPLHPVSRRQNLAVVSAMISAMHKAGYLSIDAAAGVLRGLNLPQSKINVERSFTEFQWARIMECWDEQYRAVGPVCDGGAAVTFTPTPENPDRSPRRARELRRIRVVLELAVTMGLRRIEISTARLASLQRKQIGGQWHWFLAVTGKGRKQRELLVYDDVKAMIDQHQRDVDAAGVPLPDDASRVRTINNPGASPAPAHDADPIPAGSRRALIGVLRAPPLPSLAAATTGEAHSRTATASDAGGSLDPTALYQSLKRFFRQCAKRLGAQQLDDDADVLLKASTHWLRHFFATSAAQDDVNPTVLMNMLGHASLSTTSVYLHSELKAMVHEMAKVRRR